MVDRGRADEPDRGEEVLTASNHVVHVEQLVQVEEQTRQVRDEEHAHYEDEEQGELEVLGLKRNKHLVSGA